jgi:ATP adenylyltransferase
MEYITREEEGCLFCEKRDYVVHSGRHAYVMLNAFPYNHGHLMVAPYRHVHDLEELNDDESGEIIDLVKLSQDVLKRLLKPDGFNIGINIGKVAGAGEEHLHIHVVPRWEGDTNFMPILAEVRVIPEHLESTYEKLTEAFRDKL